LGPFYERHETGEAIPGRIGVRDTSFDPFGHKKNAKTPPISGGKNGETPRLDVEKLEKFPAGRGLPSGGKASRHKETGETPLSFTR